ncbi:MAG: EamA family transporter [Actinomycetota bacterium]|nr:EamA family transporter [Actinomycetota bacterium]
MAETGQIPDRSTLAAFAGAVVIGGTNFIAVRFSNEELDPLFGAGIRFVAAALLLFALMRLQRIRMPRSAEAVGPAVYGLLGFGVSYALLYYALVGLTAGTAAVFMAATPLVTLVLAVLHGQERFTARGVAGGVLAVVGILVISLDSLGGDLRPVYLIAALLGVVTVAESSVVVKGLPQTHPVTTNAVGMAAGGLLLVAASLAFREDWVVPERAKTWMVLAWLVVAGSVGLFVLFLFVIARWTASATVYALTLMPVVAVTLGALVADEPVTIELIAGGALVMTAVYVGALSGRTPKTATVPEAAPAVETAPGGGR